MRNFKKQAGATLMELTMVVGIIAIISIAGISYYNMVNNGNKIKDEVNNLNSLSAAVRNMFNTQGNYTGLTNQVILKSSTFPDRMRIAGNGNHIKHSWLNDGVDVAPKSASSTDDRFTVTYKDVPQDACSDLVSNTYRHFISVKVGSTQVTGAATAATACSSATNDIVYETR
ncbi:type 4 pilus major pilin [Vibrio owensii]|uniref:type 4 pilus major pilin n=1 Tax=Vibrio harveyi group TaxID=717610 RepID=UPI003CC57EC3